MNTNGATTVNGEATSSSSGSNVPESLCPSSVTDLVRLLDEFESAVRNAAYAEAAFDKLGARSHQDEADEVRAALLSRVQTEGEGIQDSVHLAAGDGQVPAAYENRTSAGSWKPIETAPKDGRVIRLGFMEDGAIAQTADMQWSHIQRNGLFPGQVGMWVCPGGNFTWNPVPAEFGPTHWMPLPPAPQNKEN